MRPVLLMDVYWCCMASNVLLTLNAERVNGSLKSKCSWTVVPNITFVFPGRRGQNCAAFLRSQQENTREQPREAALQPDPCVRGTVRRKEKPGMVWLSHGCRLGAEGVASCFTCDGCFNWWPHPTYPVLIYIHTQQLYTHLSRQKTAPGHFRKEDVSITDDRWGYESLQEVSVKGGNNHK